MMENGTPRGGEAQEKGAQGPATARERQDGECATSGLPSTVGRPKTVATTPRETKMRGAAADALRAHTIHSMMPDRTPTILKAVMSRVRAIDLGEADGGEQGKLE